MKSGLTKGMASTDVDARTADDFSMSTDVVTEDVRGFWESQSCGEIYSSGATLAEQLDAQARARYALEPYIAPFAKFEDGRGRDVLEIGVGMGADHLEWARVRPRTLVGIDLTERAVRFTRARLLAHGVPPRLATSDAERLPFPDASFDLVYSWGVLHHSPDTGLAVREVHRVLRHGGRARVMLYHKHSIVGYLLWIRYALLKGRLDRSLADIYSEHLESPGTKAFTVGEARRLFSGFATVRATSLLSFGDLLEGRAGQRHGRTFLAIARTLWPRWLIRRLLPTHGLDLLIDAVK
jgi:SAM-dependent methyltransferase